MGRKFLCLTVLVVGLALPLPVLSAGLIGLGSLPELSAAAGDGPLKAPRLSAPRIYAGYLGTPKVVFAGRSERTGPVMLADYSYGFPAQGLWLAGAQKVRLSDTYNLVINGSYLLPANRDGTEELLLPPNIRQVRDLKTSIQWWSAGFAVVSNRIGGVKPVAGFLYDAFSSGFKTENPGNAGIGSDEADLSVTGLIPYVGLVIEQGQVAGGALTAGAAAFPLCPAHVKWGATYGGQERNWVDGLLTRGYFFQLAVDYKVDFGQARAGVFASWSSVRSLGVPSNRAENPVVEPGATFSNTFKTSFDRQAWIIGANFDLSFSMPY